MDSLFEQLLNNNVQYTTIGTLFIITNAIIIYGDVMVRIQPKHTMHQFGELPKIETKQNKTMEKQLQQTGIDID